jgi:hypothetical protein
MKQEIGNPERDAIHQYSPVAAVRRLDGVPHRSGSSTVCQAALVSADGWQCVPPFLHPALAGGDIAEGRRLRQAFPPGNFCRSGTTGDKYGRDKKPRLSGENRVLKPVAGYT